MNDTVEIPESKLHALYVEQRLSTREIAKRYKCSAPYVNKLLREAGILVRSRSEAALARNETNLQDFSGDPVECAYLIGFRIGDLTVKWKRTNSQIIIVDGSSPRPEQADLIRYLFERYGPVSVKPYTDSKGVYRVTIRCSLNSSFGFLIEKPDHVPAWILSNQEDFIAFFAGYVDAEGSFYVRRWKEWTPSGVFILNAAAKPIIQSCREKLIEFGVNCGELKVMRRAGTTNKQGVTTRKDVWGFQVVAKDSLLRLIALLEPYLKHAKRRADVQSVKANIEWRQSEIFQAQVRQMHLENLRRRS